MLSCSLAPAFAARTSYAPGLGDSAEYILTTPIGTSVVKKILVAYDSATDTYSVRLDQDSGGQQQSKLEKVKGPDLRASYISEIRPFCEARGGQLVTVDWRGQPLPACKTEKNNLALRQYEIWVSQIPFGLFDSERKSPLHPRADTRTTLTGFSRPSAF